MSEPTTGIYLNSQTPAAPTGQQTVIFQSDGASPQQSITAYDQIMVGDSGSGGLAGNVPAPGAGDAAAGKFFKADGTYAVPDGGSSGTINGTISLVIDGGGAVPATGAKGFVQLPNNCTITGWTMLADQSGSAQITVSKGTYADYPTLSSIDASLPPNLSSEQKNTSTTLTGWTTAVTAGDVLAFNLDSVTSCQRIVLQLLITVNPTVQSIGLVIDGNGSVPATGAKGFLQIPYACTITGWTLLADQSGSAQVTVSKGTYADYPTLSSIDASLPPNLSSEQKNTSTTLTGWTTAVTAGDVIAFNLDSVTSCQRIVLQLQVTPS